MSPTSDPRDGRAARWLASFCLNLSLLCQVMAAGLGKFAALSMPHFSAAAVVSNHYYLLSILCLIVQAVCWPFVLRRYSLSFAYFYMSASYVGILLMSALVFHEPVTALNATGAALIIIGVNIVVRGRSEVHDHAT